MGRFSHKQRPAAHSQPVTPIQHRAMPENVTAHMADFFEDAQAALNGQADFPAQASRQLMNQRSAFPHQVARALGLEIKQGRPVIAPAVFADLRFVDMEACLLYTSVCSPWRAAGQRRG